MKALRVTLELALVVEDDDPLLTLSDGQLEDEVLRLVRQEDYALTLVTAEAEPTDED